MLLTDEFHFKNLSSLLTKSFFVVFKVFLISSQSPDLSMLTLPMLKVLCKLQALRLWVLAEAKAKAEQLMRLKQLSILNCLKLQSTAQAVLLLTSPVDL